MCGAVFLLVPETEEGGDERAEDLLLTGTIRVIDGGTGSGEEAEREENKEEEGSSSCTCTILAWTRGWAFWALEDLVLLFGLLVSFLTLLVNETIVGASSSSLLII